MIVLVFLAISTAPGVLMLALLCAFLRGIDHDVFADEHEDEYEGLETRPSPLLDLPTAALAAALPAVKSGAPFPPWLSRPPL